MLQVKYTEEKLKKDPETVSINFVARKQTVPMQWQELCPKNLKWLITLKFRDLIPEIKEFSDLESYIQKLNYQNSNTILYWFRKIRLRQFEKYKLS